MLFLFFFLMGVVCNIVEEIRDNFFRFLLEEIRCLINGGKSLLIIRRCYFFVIFIYCSNLGD